MPRLTTRPPKYRRHKASGQAVVTLNGRDVYLGIYGSEESTQVYGRLIGQWSAGHRQAPARRLGHDLSVDELIASYLEHADGYYRKHGEPTDTIYSVRQTLTLLHEMYGPAELPEFGPLALKHVRQEMVERGWCLSTINKFVAIIKQMFKWGVENEMVAPETYQALQAVAGLRRGRSQAREPEPVKPAPEEQIEAVLDRVSAPVAAMIRLQWCTGMRPDEVVSMRSGDIDRSGPVWVYVPGSHKMEHAGKQRRIFLGPRAQDVTGRSKPASDGRLKTGHIQEVVASSFSSPGGLETADGEPTERGQDSFHPDVT